MKAELVAINSTYWQCISMSHSWFGRNRF